MSVLVIGAGVLHGMTVRQLKAVLAHEYGHFHNEDTAGGGFALAVRRSLVTMAISLIQGGVATWYNPAWWFVRGFHAVFLRISQGASRLQEVLADRWAAFAYGSRAFEDGLKHVIVQSVRFDAHAGATLKDVIDAKRPLRNLYRYEVSTDDKDVDEQIAEAMGRDAGAYDSHPAPKDRIAWVRRLDAQGEAPAATDSADAWSLFTDQEKVEETMTREIRERVMAAHGIHIAG